MSELRDLADVAVAWRLEGRAGILARVASTSGLGAVRVTEAMAVDADGETVGDVLGGAATSVVRGEARRLLHSGAKGAELVYVTLDDDQAVAAGLACGGQARLLLEPLSGVPDAVWPRLRDREPVVLETHVGGVTTFSVPAHTPPTSSRSLEATDEGGRLIDTVVPTTEVLVVGGGELGAALERQASFLGWTTTIVLDGPTAESAAAALGPADGLIVLSHDPEIDTPVLAAGLTGRAGYVGALGSRHTQAGRRQRLTAVGLGEPDLARIHGPVGLDLGGRAPEEVALSICAEIVAERYGRRLRPGGA